MRHQFSIAAVVVVALIAGAAAWADDKPCRFAVLVGVNRYEHERLRPLEYAVADVTDLAEVLRSAGYEVSLLSDKEGSADAQRRPTKANIERALRAVLRRCRKGDTMIVGFAGHGVQFEGERDCFFCPADARPVKGATDSLVSLSRVYDEMDASFAGMKVLLVDACRDDPASGRGRQIDADAAPFPPYGVAALFSCRAGERAFETGKLKHGVFFHHVIEGLKGGAADADGDVTFAGLAAYASRRVARDVPELIGGGARQSPHLKADYALEPVLVQTAPGDRKPRTRVEIPSTPELLCRRIAAELHAQVKRKGLERVGVVEFFRPHGGGIQLAAESLPRYCAELLAIALKKLAGGAYAVVSPAEMAAAMKGATAQSARETAGLRQAASQAKVDGVVFGVLRTGGPNLTLRCELISPGRGDVIGASAGASPLNEDLIADAGLTIDNRERPAGPPIAEAVIRHAQEAAGAGLPLDFPFKLEVHRVEVRSGENITKDSPRKRKVPRARDVETATGNTRKEYLVGVRDGELIELHVRNDARVPVAVQLMVDGLNTQGQTRDRLGQGRMWLLQPGVDYVIAGWHLPGDVLKRFRIEDASRSVAGRQGFGESIGLITAAFYYEFGRALGVGEGPEEKRALVMKDFRAGRLAGAVQLRYVDERVLND